MERIVDESPSPTTRAASRPSIGISLPCHRCGYEMRGLDPRAVCPECGEPVWRSIAEAVDLVPVPIDERSSRPLARAFEALAATVVIATLASILPPAAWIPAAWWDEFAASSGWAWGGLFRRLAEVAIATVVLAAVLLWWGHRGSPLASAMLALPRRLLVLGGVPWGLTLAALHAGWLPPIAVTAVTGTALGVVLIAASLAAERIGPVSRRWRTGGTAIQRPWALIAALAIGLAGLGVRGAVEAAGGRTGSGLVPQVVEGLWAVAAFVSVLSMLLVCVGAIYLAMNLWWIARDLRRRRPAIGEVMEAHR